MSNFVKIRPLIAEFYADVRADMANLTVAILNFAKTPKTLLPQSIRSFSDDAVGWCNHGASG
jgi:hypothetical protein